jgi:hypothetical protein
MNDRERSQLVISLGEGQEGLRLREALDRAAKALGKPVSAWARETLLAAAGEGPGDPIIEIRLNGSEVTLLDLRAIDGMQSGWSIKVRALISGSWWDLGTNNPDELVTRWKRVRRWGLM